ncbi:apolipoprotein D-like [Arapaima gigas]
MSSTGVPAKATDPTVEGPWFKSHSCCRLLDKGLPPGNCWVLSTNYDSYSLVYSCNTSMGLRTEFAWILSRNQTLSREPVARLWDTLRSSCTDADKLTATKQTACCHEQLTGHDRGRLSPRFGFPF